MYHENRLHSLKAYSSLQGMFQFNYTKCKRFLKEVVFPEGSLKDWQFRGINCHTHLIGPGTSPLIMVASSFDTILSNIARFSTFS